MDIDQDKLASLPATVQLKRHRLQGLRGFTAQGGLMWLGLRFHSKRETGPPKLIAANWDSIRGLPSHRSASKPSSSV